MFSIYFGKCFEGHGFSRQSYIQNTTKTCNLLMLFDFFILYFVSLNFWYYAYLQKGYIWFYSVQSVCLIYCQRTNRKHFKNPCLVIFQFLRHLYVGTWDISHWHIENRLDFTAWGMSLTQIRNNNGPKIEPCDTPHDILL